MASKDTFFCLVDTSLIQLYIANENGREVVMALGELGLNSNTPSTDHGEVCLYRRSF
jgi:hypothetical protein